jgi:glycosyltransferase involved in cell wall biosynthesis
LRQTELCNGPIHTIENGIDLSLLPPPPSDQQGVLIAGLKNPELAKSLCDRLRGHSIEVECLTSHIPRSVYLEKLSKTRIAVTLPNKTEGFYLPALEAMAMGLALVCPDCVGNRSFCRDCVTCLMPEMDLKSLEAASLRLVEDTDLSQRLRTNALAQSRLHSIEMERGLFLNLMRRIVDEPLT